MKKFILRFKTSLKKFGSFGISLVAGIIFLLSGCTTYQYIGITGNAHQNKLQNFVVQNDTVKIVYTFEGYNVPMKVQIYNELNRPLYVDWNQSVLTVNGKATSYWKNSATFTGSYFAYSFSGTIHSNEKISYIPPKSYVEPPVFYLIERFYDTRYFSTGKKERFNSLDRIFMANRYLFNNKNAPLKLKSYITLSMSKDFSTEFHITRSFWLNQIIQTGVPPWHLQNANFSRTYISKPTEGGLLAVLLVLLGLVAGAAALAK